MVQERTSTLGKDPWAHCQPERDLLVKRPWPSGRVLCWIAAFPNFTAKSCQMSEKHSFKGNNFMPKYRPKSRQFIGRIFLEKKSPRTKKSRPNCEISPNLVTLQNSWAQTYSCPSCPRFKSTRTKNMGEFCFSAQNVSFHVQAGSFWPLTVDWYCKIVR